MVKMLNFTRLVQRRQRLADARRMKRPQVEAATTNVVVDVEDAWLKDVQKRVNDTTWPGHKCTIYRVPHWLRIIDTTAYEPQVLSLGPYHYNNYQLRAMDELKWFYLNSFLTRIPGGCLKMLLQLVVAKEPQTREAYSEAPSMDKEDWVKMMLLDSCFVIELLLISNNKKADHIQRIMPLLPHILYDILLLENQLPFFLLEELLKLTSSSIENNGSLSEIVFDVFVDLMPGKLQPPSRVNIGDIHHILHFLYSCTLPNHSGAVDCGHHGLRRRLYSFFVDTMLCKFRGRNRCNHENSESDEPSPLQWVPSAKNLIDAGVVFQKKTNNMASFMEITFRRGMLEIPPIQICGRSNSVFRNLIAFEQCDMRNLRHHDWGAYAYLMNCIINTPADIALLQQAGIIVSILGNEDDIARFFNQLNTNTVFFNKNYLSSVYSDVQRHCNKKTNKWKASLHYGYFSNPWTIISIIAAAFLFLLTMTQTVFAILSYFQPRLP